MGKPKRRYRNNPLPKLQSRQRELATKQQQLIKRARDARKRETKRRT